jgi:DNA replication protein DnaC
MKFVGNLDEQRKSGMGLLLHGTTGKGKSSAAMLVAKEIIRRDGFPLIVDAWEIPRIEIEDKELAHKMHATSFLVIDDLGAGAGKEAAQAFVEQLIRDRDARELPMIITTNLFPVMETDVPEKDRDKTLGSVVGEACARVILERCMKVNFL